MTSPSGGREGFGLGALVFAFLLGGFGGGLAGVVGTYMASYPAASTGAEDRALGRKVMILAARQEVFRGQVLAREDLTVLEWPVKFLPPRYLPRSLLDDVVGQEMEYTVKRGQPILTTDLASTASAPPPAGKRHRR